MASPSWRDSTGRDGLEQLRKQHEWSHITDADYLAQRDAVNATLHNLPDDDRIR